MNVYQESAQAVLERLQTNTGSGLSATTVHKRLEQYGSNELVAKKSVNPLILFLSQFRNFIIYILLFAVGISLLAHEYVDAIIILIILVFNAVFGFIQEYRAEKSIEALKKLAAFKTTVIRDGKHQLVDAKDLVPGDIMVLEVGNKISADARLIEAMNLEVEESSLTGEASTVKKITQPLKKNLPINDQTNMVFSGTSVAKGRGLAIVVRTGMQTEIGKIAGMITEVKDEQTPLQKKLDKLGKVIGGATLAVCFIIFVSGILRDGLEHLLFAGEYVAFLLAAKHWLITSVSLAVAAVPEGLPAIVTIALAIGVNKMLKRKALIRNLPSVETLGETTVICSDKTGTLTKNQMTVQVAYANGREFVVTGQGYALDGSVTHDGKKLSGKDLLLFKIGALCNDAKLSSSGIVGDPTEGSLLVSAHKAGLPIDTLFATCRRIDEKPFDSERKMMTTINLDPLTHKTYAYVKGAPENVLAFCNRILLNGKVQKLTPQMRKSLLERNKGYAKTALRVLGFAYKEYSAKDHREKNLIFVGLQGMMDPPHDDVKDSIAKCYAAGIRVLMITGDNKYTARGIAQKIGIQGDSMDGIDFGKLSHEEQLSTLATVSIFSRVEPAHKLQIVSLLQEQGNIVTMTGDGVNDAPAIKKADLGIAMGITGTDVTKEASKMIVLDDKFTSIVDAIEEGRSIYANIKKFVNYLLSCNAAEVLIIFLAILFGWHLPLTAIMLLWLNLVTDGLPALALSVDPMAKNMMNKPPEPAQAGIMDRKLFSHITYVAVLITVGVLGLFYWAMQYYSGSPDMIGKTQTIAFTALIVMEVVRLQAIRSEYNLGVFSNGYLTLAVVFSLVLQLIVIYTPLSFYFKTVPLSFIDWSAILLVSAAIFVSNVFGIKLLNKCSFCKR